MHSFTTNCDCTIPPEGISFVNAVPIRGTLQILWSSLGVLVLCTWSVVYLNVPPQHRTRTKTQKLRRTLNRVSKKVAWMLFNVLAPEWIMAKALLDWIAVRQLSSRYKAQAARDNVPWSNTHTHFANMGGFGISFQDLAQIKQSSNIIGGGQPKNIDWTAWIKQIDTTGWARVVSLRSAKVLSKSKAASQGWRVDNNISKMIADLPIDQTRDFADQSPTWTSYLCLNLLILRADLWILDAAQLLKAREVGIINSLPNISGDDLADRDNSNMFVKVLAACQTSWFGLQFLIRFANGQANTQLEVMVFAFAICSAVVHTFTWNRPKDPEYTIISNADNYPSTGMDIARVAFKGPSYFGHQARRTIWCSNLQISLIDGCQSSSNLGLCISSGFASVFGALHCIAWHFTFPSEIEQTLWRASSLMTILAGPSFCVLSLLASIVPQGKKWTKVPAFLMSIICLTPPIAFAFARLFIIVEAFRSLGFQPPQAFLSTWIGSAPHIG